MSPELHTHARNSSARDRQSLATGFRDVDRSGDAEACNRCLDLIAGIPFFHKVKEESFRIIAGTHPRHVLDAGCGAGGDLVLLPDILPAGCQIAGLDASASLLALAAERTRTIRDNCSLVKGDLLHHPFRDNVFDACRIDRVLQHIHQPERGIAELWRTLKPGGTLVAFDNDWDTFAMSLEDSETVGKIRRFWCDSFASGNVGCDLPRIFAECRFVDIHAEPRTLVLADLAVAERVFDLPDLLERMVRAGSLAPAETAAVWEELLRRSFKGAFTSGYTGHLVWGTKPG